MKNEMSWLLSVLGEKKMKHQMKKRNKVKIIEWIVKIEKKN